MHLLILKNIVLIILELIKNKLCVEVYKGIYEDVLKGDIEGSSIGKSLFYLL
jgi:hypothetical protein